MLASDSTTVAGDGECSELAFQAFFRRVKAGEKEVGYPRFKAYDRYDSFCYPQSGYALQGDVLSLSKVGQVRVKLHRPLKGEIKTVCIRKQAGFWYHPRKRGYPASPSIVKISRSLRLLKPSALMLD